MAEPSTLPNWKNPLRFSSDLCSQGIFYRNLDPEALRKAICLAEDQAFIRQELKNVLWLPLSVTALSSPGKAAFLHAR